MSGDHNMYAGGPAFPRMGERCQSINEDGMTLRDYFAAKTMAAILQSGTWGPKTADALHYEDDQQFVENRAACLAEGAYQMADSMLKAREA